MAFNEEMFLKNKPELLNVRKVCGEKILTTLERAVR